MSRVGWCTMDCPACFIGILAMDDDNPHWIAGKDKTAQLAEEVAESNVFFIGGVFLAPQVQVSYILAS